MKKNNSLLFFFLFIFFVSFTFTREIKNYSNSFFGVYGKKASVMGKVDGSAFETWIYPYKVLHDFRFNIIVNGAVWPFLTGFTSLALYNYDNPFHAFSLLQANLKGYCFYFAPRIPAAICISRYAYPFIKRDLKYGNFS